MRFSAALINKILDDGLTGAFSNPVMHIRSGPPPSTVGSASTGSLLCVVEIPPSGYFGNAVDGSKISAGGWSGEVQSAGVAGWFLIKEGFAPVGLAPDAIRIDGTLGSIDEDIQLDTTTLEVGDDLSITGIVISIESPGMTLWSHGTSA